MNLVVVFGHDFWIGFSSEEISEGNDCIVTVWF